MSRKIIIGLNYRHPRLLHRARVNFSVSDKCGSTSAVWWHFLKKLQLASNGREFRNSDWRGQLPRVCLHPFASVYGAGFVCARRGAFLPLGRALLCLFLIVREVLRKQSVKNETLRRDVKESGLNDATWMSLHCKIYRETTYTRGRKVQKAWNNKSFVVEIQKLREKSYFCYCFLKTWSDVCYLV